MLGLGKVNEDRDKTLGPLQLVLRLGCGVEVLMDRLILNELKKCGADGNLECRVLGKLGVFGGGEGLDELSLGLDGIRRIIHGMRSSTVSWLFHPS